MQMVNETRWVDPDQLVGSVSSLLKEILNELDPNCVRGIGICSMAESGLLINTPESNAYHVMIPWFDRSDESQVKLIREKSHEEEVFSWSGIRATYKCPLARILWLQKRNPPLWKTKYGSRLPIFWHSPSPVKPQPITRWQPALWHTISTKKDGIKAGCKTGD